jgi:hypothetical protein
MIAAGAALQICQSEQELPLLCGFPAVKSSGGRRAHKKRQSDGTESFADPLNARDVIDACKDGLEVHMELACPGRTPTG